MSDTTQEQNLKKNYDFPGRWLGGAALIFGPLLMLTGVALRYRFHFFFPDQLAAFQDYPALLTASYNAFAAGNVLMLPAVILLAKRIAGRRPHWAFWGATFSVFGLFTRTFHAGVDHLAFQLVRQQSADAATQVIADSYSAFHIFKTFNLAVMLGWIVLAIGSYLSRALTIYQCIGLALMSSLPLGVLKGSTALSVVATIGLCAALLPFGVKVLRDGPKPSATALSCGIALSAALIGFFYFFGQAG